MNPMKHGCALPTVLILGLLLSPLLLLPGCQPGEEPAPVNASPEPLQSPQPRAPAAASPRDLHLDIDPDSISVSGISSGGYMAQQLHIAHSDSFVGAGVIAAGPYGCAAGTLANAMGRCMTAINLPLEVDELAAAMTEAAAAGRIADPIHLANDRVWLFHGTADAQIGADVAAAGHALYSRYIAVDNLVFVNELAAAHHFPTLAQGHPCEQSQSPFIGACNYDAAGALLNHIYGPLNAPRGPADRTLQEVAYIEAGNAAGLMERAYVYVPARCAGSAARCRLHLVFHGCLQSAEKVGAALAEGAGYNRWADPNDLVIAYPQVQSSAFNPYGCWDWWGYTGPDHANRDGPQVAAVMDLVHRLIGSGQ